MYDVIVSDLDGTLLNSQHRISGYTQDVLHELTRRGVEFIVATGRHHVDVRAMRDQLGLNVTLVTSNGARIHDAQDKLLHNRSIPPEMVEDLLFRFRLPEVHLNLYQGDNWLVEEPLPVLLDFSPDSAFRYRVTDLRRLGMEGIDKVFFAGDHDQLVKVEDMLLAHFGDRLNITFSLPICLEVMHGEVNKGSAMASLAKQRNTPLERVIAFGDGMNDYEMLRRAGKGVVMANAHTRLQDALPHHDRTLSADEDGVARYLARLYQL
ncbi:Cof-type HAD-IIB family hydrolase [Oceanimonas sp. CAM02]|uniref:Cof-type HAD-IIB family hydrolase n=1 Tax=Oceanimonas sp. CAM02 TaxID=3080336 RepID=UPI0029359F22|nr:Cof-type HAD-IIB family hydrolase [Oceanimonas sp. CAM02]MDV2857729.1 Cof-type HAD-IIB family hydrolase [Oceanimonas sp. CAM02]